MGGAEGNGIERLNRKENRRGGPSHRRRERRRHRSPIFLVRLREAKSALLFGFMRSFFGRFGRGKRKICVGDLYRFNPVGPANLDQAFAGDELARGRSPRENEGEDKKSVGKATKDHPGILRSARDYFHQFFRPVFLE